MEFLKKHFRISILYFLFSLIVLFISCENILLGPEPKDTPKDNFEMLWKDMDRYYALFGVKKIDWKKTHDDFIKYINENTTDGELWEILCSMIDLLNDGHTSIQMGAHGEYHTSGEHNYFIDFDIGVIKNYYLKNNYYVTGNGNILFSLIPGHSIGYIYIASFLGNDWAFQIKDAVNYLRSTNSIIIDVRENIGGSLENPHIIASAFIDHDITFLKETSRSGPDHNDFEPWVYEKISPMINFEPYTKKLVLLINNRTASGSDHFVYLFKNYIPNTTLIGTNTWGIFSSIYPFRILPNGWIYTFSSRLTTSLEGVALDSIGGIKPDIYIDNVSHYYGIDTVLGTAINYVNNLS
jgi:carboxyl-terminal processing protease